MLVLSRKKGERIIIGNSVEVTVSEIRGDKVKHAFHAPHEIPIYREEVFRRIQREEREHSSLVAECV